MPTYSFECEKCSHQFESTFSVAEYDEQIKKQKCPECKSKKVYRDFDADNVHTGYTFGLSECKDVKHYAEKQTKIYGKEKCQKMREGFKTQKDQGKELPDGMKRIETIDDFKRSKGKPR